MRFKYSLHEWVQVDSGRFGKITARENHDGHSFYQVHLISCLDPYQEFNILLYPPGDFDLVQVWEDELVPREPPRVNQLKFEQWKRSQDAQHKIQNDLWKRKLGPDPGDGGRRSRSSRPRDRDDDPWSQLDMDDFEWMILKVLPEGEVHSVILGKIRELDIEVRTGKVGQEFIYQNRISWSGFQVWLERRGDGKLPTITNGAARSFNIDLEALLERRRNEARELGVLPKRLGGEKERI